ncbi:hypothetical protein CWC14_06570 [Pseudoalteromonas sp. S3260]|uniref:inovirus-type Gp2 protein n=1 Tax=Pseudoalteromonas sp. S3260 TaxID=579534 RepID=UPI00110BFF03|nr:inovirus-type Gp2 protein [Pseudoalteromonas sp. S3260]TMO98429.1 hypothetical protein CWC14_06570 [Pseudoalteromonas sp. S3260]
MPETNRRLFKKLEYKELPVNNKEQNLLVNRLESCYKLMDSASNTYAKLLHQHRVLKIPKSVSEYYTEKDFEKLTKYFFKLLENGRLWDNKDRGKLFYAWCVEREDKKGWHVHLHTFVSEKKNRATGISGVISSAWDKTLRQYIPDIELKEVTSESYNSGYVYTCTIPDNNYKYHRVLSRGNHTQLKASFYWISYICKIRKGTKPYKFGRTQIK